MIEVECKQCDGKGRLEVYAECFQPAWNCCGGCTEVIECPTCDGYGEMVIEEI